MAAHDPAQVIAPEVPPQEEVEGLDDEALDRMMGEKVSFDPEVENFLRNLYDEIYDRRVDAIRRLYEVEFPALSEKHFFAGPWPAVDDVSAFYRQYQRFHCLIITLYKELYYRHLFLKCPNDVTWADRKDSWENYALLMNFLAEVECANEEGKENKSLRLPIQWIWDFLDEFVYQFQDACRWRQKLCRQLPDDTVERGLFITCMEHDSDVWRPSQVFELLHALAIRSDIARLLKIGRDDPNAQKQLEGELRYQLGYFALILLHKMHVQVGDFYDALRVVQDVELSSKALYWKVPAAHVSFFYHLAFAYMMLRRHNDAIRLLTQLLTFVARQRSYLNSQMYQLAAMARCVDRMYILAMLCGVISNAKLDDSITQTIKEKNTDRFYKLQQESEEAYCEAFNWACPKFISPASPPSCDPAALEVYGNSHSEMQLRMCKLFLKEVENSKKISTINSFAKLYNNIQLSKLASLMEMPDKDPEDAVCSEIMSVKYKTQQKVWRSGSIISGELSLLSTDSGVEFHVDKDMIHVRNHQAHRVFVDHFLKQIDRTDALLMSIQTTPLQKPPQKAEDNRERRNTDSNRYTSGNQEFTREPRAPLPAF